MSLPSELIDAYADHLSKVDLNKLIFRTHTDVSSAYQIELLGYPPSEAATLQTLTRRQYEAPHLFFGCFLPFQGEEYLIGFITATQSKQENLTLQSMGTHQPSGKLICMHSICIHPCFQRKGVATVFLQDFLKYLKSLQCSPVLGDGSKLNIISHLYLTSWYQKLGFNLLGISEVVHGPEPWYELEFEL